MRNIAVTKRFALILGLGVVLNLLAWLINLHVFVFVGYNLLAAGLLALDCMLTPSPNVLSVRRLSGDKLYFKTENEIRFGVFNHSDHPLRIQAKDEISDRHFVSTTAQLTAVVPPGQEVIFNYKVIPGKRGSFTFEHIYLRYPGVLGVCLQYGAFPCPYRAKVYPNLLDLSKYRLMTQKNRLLPLGSKTIRLRGEGAEFESLRAYVEGDDYRRMNWMATARENKLMVNHYQEEKNQPVFVLLDAGRPMSYSVNGYKKLDYAINAALILSDIVNQQGDNSGLMVFDHTVQTCILPGKGAAHRNRLMEALYQVDGVRQTSDYERAFETFCQKQKRRALVFIFTDFELLEEAQELMAYMALLKKRHKPVVVFMKNESLSALSQQPAHTRHERAVRQAADEFLAERRLIFRKLNAMGIPNIESAAESFAATAVNRYLRQTRHV